MSLGPVIADLQPGSIPKRAYQFDCDNPHVYLLLVACCRIAKHDWRYTSWSINTAWHGMRFWWSLTTRGDTFKLNNSYAPYFARLLLIRENDLDAFLDLREGPHSESEFDWAARRSAELGPAESWDGHVPHLADMEMLLRDVIQRRNVIDKEPS